MELNAHNTPRTQEDFAALVKALNEADSNEKKLEVLEGAKGWGAESKLFTCAHLLACMDVTPSTKVQFASSFSRLRTISSSS